MAKMITTIQAGEMLAARGIPAPYQTIVRWARLGKLAGAQLTDTPRGPVWLIPVSSVEKFTPPKRGRQPNADKKPAQRRGRKAA